MFDVLPVPLPRYVVGPLMGLLVAGLYAVTNNHLGISGAYVQFVDRSRGCSTETWRLWFLGGTIAGAAMVAFLGGNPQAGPGYGALGEYLPMPALIAVLLVRWCIDRFWRTLGRRLYLRPRSHRLRHWIAREYGRRLHVCRYRGCCDLLAAPADSW